MALVYYFNLVKVMCILVLHRSKDYLLHVSTVMFLVV